MIDWLRIEEDKHFSYFFWLWSTVFPFIYIIVGDLYGNYSFHRGNKSFHAFKIITSEFINWSYKFFFVCEFNLGQRLNLN